MCKEEFSRIPGKTADLQWPLRSYLLTWNICVFIKIVFK